MTKPHKAATIINNTATMINTQRGVVCNEGDDEDDDAAAAAAEAEDDEEDEDEAMVAAISMAETFR